MEIQFLDQTFGKEARNLLDQAVMESIEGARAALETFYYAFNNKDLDVFSKVWVEHPLIQLNNPVGGVMRGKDNIYQLYANIFQSAAKVWVEFHDIVEYFDGNIAVFAGKEKGEFHVGNQTISLNIRTTRFFAYTDHQWYQIHHHGSIDDPNLLLTYQNAVQKK